MAKNNIPTALDMRHLKYGEASPAERARVAQALRQAGRRAEAILLYERHAEDGQAFLAEEVTWAVAEGQAFHLLSIQRSGHPVSDDELRRCAKSALERGRFMDARLCYDAVGDVDAIRAFEERIPPSLRPEAPATDEDADN